MGRPGFGRASAVSGGALGTGLGPSWAGPGVWALVWAARKGLDWAEVGLGFL